MVKAQLADSDGNTITFRFNPSEYSIKKSAEWKAPGTNKGGTAGAKPHFAGTRPQTLTMQIFFDGWDTGEDDYQVTKDVDQLLDWTNPTKDSLSKEKPQPAILYFSWGTNAQLSQHKYYLQSVGVKYELFDSDGQPMRATADISLQEVPQDDGAQNPTSGAIHARGTHTLTEGDSLASVATKEFGNPNLWRGLAAFNGIDDPLRLEPGTRLLLPSLEEAAKLTQQS